MKILLAEDDPPTRLILKKKLEDLLLVISGKMSKLVSWLNKLWEHIKIKSKEKLSV